MERPVLTDADIAEGRAIAESEMRDTCTVLRPTGETTIDQNTGAEVEEFTTVYTGKCRLRMATERGGSAQRQVGEQTVTITRIELQVPWNVDYLQVDDRSVITVSESPGLANRAVQLVGPWLQTTSAKCSYPCVESTIPEVAA